MKASDLHLAELVRFEEGAIRLHGRRLVLHSIHAMAQFRRDLMDMVGPEQARRIFTRFGFFWGNADAAAMTRIFEWDSLEEWLRAGPRMHTLQGVTRTVVKDLICADDAFEMALIWHESGEAEEHLIEFGRADAPVCWMLTGYMSGYATFCMGRPIYFIEDACRAKGDRVCSAVGRAESDWGDALAAHLPYYQSEDIQGKVQSLTAELRRQTEELARHRRRLAVLEGQHDVASPLIEVHSDAFRRVIDIATRAAPFDSSVLVTGESGVGKEVLARHIHTNSKRAGGPFLAVNCGALPETLLESELFGHRRGAFTGAVDDRVGLFEQGAGGTLFLDEIGDVAPAMQVKLLRVLQEREIMRVGESTTRPVDVRVIAATNRNLVEGIDRGEFREDLYYRLGVIEIEVPPLRERPEDVLPLARHFAARLRERLALPDLSLDATSLDLLQAYAWPGNVRELENAIERAAVLSPSGRILPEYLPPAVADAGRARGIAGDPRRSLAEVERDHIDAVLQLTGGNRTRAAGILGISSTTLWRKLKES